MSGLFEESDRLETIPLADAEVSYLSEFDLGRHPNELLRELISDVPWRQHRILVWGKLHLQPRQCDLAFERRSRRPVRSGGAARRESDCARPDRRKCA